MAQAAIEGLRLYGVAAVESTTVVSLAEGTSIVPFRMLGAVVAPTRYTRVSLDESEMNLDASSGESGGEPFDTGIVRASAALAMGGEQGAAMVRPGQ